MNVNTHTTGHHATSGGLRGHSTGGLYPISCVGRIIDGKVWWLPTNLETGETWPKAFRNGEHAAGIAAGMRDLYVDGFNARQTVIGAGIEGVTEITLAGELNVDARRFPR